MPYSTEQVLLTLAGLAYRGFHDLQHLDAYLAELNLLGKEMSALTFFF